MKVFTLSFQEGHFEDALKKFTMAQQVLGYTPHLSYNAALCCYRLHEYTSALKHIGIALKNIFPLYFQCSTVYTVDNQGRITNIMLNKLYFAADIIERGIREHPELSVGMATEGIEVRSVGNTLTLHDTALIEAFNLKAAIEYQLKNCKVLSKISRTIVC